MPPELMEAHNKTFDTLYELCEAAKACNFPPNALPGKSDLHVHVDYRLRRLYRKQAGTRRTARFSRNER